MPAYQYQHGDRPLDGYTIQHAAGRGGFGEVYYALSDSGREVALKAVQGYEDIELRGIGQCMNLKSPHLVSIFDVRHNADGKPFVIMEFVAGPSLRQLLDESPSGLGEQKAAFFLREIAKGLTYLHDAGIVHRDLKPGNIFYEDGFVKIGDYGLSKLMAASMHSGQTVTVGTVHYMAPEVGQGKYDRSIDIYALGCMLYEMLTGTTPFFGSSPSEVLMKHLSAEPDLSNVSEPFATAIRRSLAKDPAERYQSVQEMVEQVFGAEHVRESVSVFRPESLSMVAQRVGAKVGAGAAGVAAGSAPSPKPAVNGQSSWSQTFPPTNAGDGVNDARRHDDAQRRHEPHRHADRLDLRHDAAPHGARRVQPRHVHLRANDVAEARYDPLTAGRRRFLALATIVCMTGAIALFAQGPTTQVVNVAVASLLAMFGAVVGVGLTRSHVAMHLTRQAEHDGRQGRRFIFGLLAVVGAGIGVGISALVSLALQVPATLAMTGTLMTLLGSMFAARWHSLVATGRMRRIVFWPALMAGFLAFLISVFFSNVDLVPVLGIVTGAILAVQVSAPWDPTARERARTLNLAARDGKAPPIAHDAPTWPGSGSAQQVSHDNVKQSQPAADNRAMKPEHYLQRYNISEHKRLWALLMSFGWFVGINGLQRFYVGKIWTGILWFITGGLFGIGQLIDVILIVSGNFKDCEGRPLVVWERLDELKYMPAERLAPHRVVDHGPSYGPIPTPALAQNATTPGGSFLLTAFASLALLGALACGIFAALDVPRLMATDSAIATWWQAQLGNANWPATLEQVSRFTMFGLAGVAMLATLFNRRRQGLTHVGRAAMGVAGVVAAMHILESAMLWPDWTAVMMNVDTGHVGLAIEKFIDAIDGGKLLIAGGLTIASLTVLAWPAQTGREETDSAPLAAEGA